MFYALIIIVAVLVLCAVAWLVAFVKFRARMQHYVFAHQLLPKLMFEDPQGVLVPMVDETGFSEAGRQHLLQLWEAAGEGFSGRDLVSGDSLTYSMVVLGHPNSTAFFVRLPPPEKTTEAHFALMVFDAPGLCCDRIRQLRYFVLENYGKKNGTPKTQLGEWIPKAGGLKYADHGAGTPPGQQAFMARVQQIIETSGSQPEPAKPQSSVPPADPRIIGFWKIVGGDYPLIDEYRADGSMVQHVGERSSDPMPFQIEGDHVILSLEQPDGEVIEQKECFAISDDTLTLVNDDGTKRVFRRTQQA